MTEVESFLSKTVKVVEIFMGNIFDVAVIGAGAVGSAIARELTRYKLKIALIEKNPDVCFETSGRNSGVVHAGFNNRPGTLMANFCVKGNRMFEAIAKELDVPFKRTGKLVVGFTDDDRERLNAMKQTGEENGVSGLEIIEKTELNRKAPGIGGEFALWSPTTGVFNPFEYTIALAENAVKNGAQIFLNSEVKSISFDSGLYHIETDKSSFSCRWIINSAGLNSAHISDMLGIHGYKIHPCRGEYFILDKRAGDFLKLPVYPVPNPKSGGLGIHLTPSVDGNVFVGPSNEYIDSCDDYSATAEVMDMLIKDGSRIFPHLKREYFIRNFSGIRPKLAEKSTGGYHDFVIEHRKDIAPRAINLVGIESPGMTSSVPIAEYVAELIKNEEKLIPNPEFSPSRRAIPSFRDKSPAEQARLISENPDYGEIICRCETITKAEVLQAIRNPLGADTLTGIKYRCRAMMGRCQGGYCQTRIAELIMQEKEKKPEDILYKQKGSYLFSGTVCDK